MRIRGVVQNFFLMLVVIGITAALAEVVLQLVVPLVYRPRITRLDDTLGWFHHSAVATTNLMEGHRYRTTYNSHGYRWPEHALAKPPRTQRVVVLGDSFVDGSEVGDEELFTWHLQQALPGTEVVNLGVYGYSTAQELLTLESKAFGFAPDVVVLVSMSNDLPGNVVNFSFFGPAPRYVLEADSLRLEPATGPTAMATFANVNLPLPGMAFFHRHSLVYHFLNSLIYQRLASRRVAAELERQKAAVTRADQVELYRRLVRRMQEVCERQGVRFVVVLAYERGEMLQASPPRHRNLGGLLGGDGVQVVDLYDTLRLVDGSPASLYYEHDIHWNARGHEVVAEALRPILAGILRGPTAPVPPG